METRKKQKSPTFADVAIARGFYSSPNGIAGTQKDRLLRKKTRSRKLRKKAKLGVSQLGLPSGRISTKLPSCLQQQTSECGSMTAAQPKREGSRMRITIVCGTNREGALSRMLATEAAECYRELGHDVDLLDMAELPADVLAQTAYKEKTPAIQALVDRFLASEGVVFVIPEYNGSYPGVLKLFIDMLPFPEGLDARPCAFIGLAAGQFKALRSVEHFQQVTRLPQRV